jgi:TolB protein
MKTNPLFITRKTIFFSLLIALLSIVNSSAQIPGSKIGVFDSFSNIGNPGFPGEALYDHTNQMYKITGSGTNIWFATDSFSYLWKKMDGDFIVQTNIKFIGKGLEPHRKTGIMIRSSNAANASMVVCTIHGDGLMSLQYRSKDGADVKEIKFKAVSSDILQLEKKGTTYTMSVAQFGSPYTSEKIENIDLGSNPVAGLFVCAHNNKNKEQVEFFNTRIFNTAADNLQQYKEYLGSLLEIMDVETGNRQVIASDEGSWQAPNWTPDGKKLIYNASGKLYNFDLATQTSSELNTDFAIKNNNDHVLSFDGKQIGISHHDKESNGKSQIYTLPITGGIPKQVTKLSPSYLHGWSPDSKFLLYTAERNGDYDIYKISVDGGKEQQLTKSKGLDDGSEYSPDGKYIYFNSTRTGTMKIWRMDADGKNPIQLTSDEYNDWFPHISPDNKSLVFISFPKEVQADKHPFYERVYIRTMSIAGGDPKVIGYVYGGQGTMNVPSWSPDSKKIALISNGYFIKK